MTVSVALTLAWAAFTSMLVLLVGLMSLDEEWQGFWHDAGLNPYIALPYLVFSAAFGLPALVLLASVWTDIARGEERRKARAGL